MKKLLLFLFTFCVFVCAEDVKVDFRKAKLTNHAKIENGILICDVPSDERKGFHGLFVPVNLKNVVNGYVVWTRIFLWIHGGKREGGGGSAYRNRKCFRTDGI